MKWRDPIWEEECPFCNDIDNNIIIKFFNNWKIVLNKYPYNWIKNHLLLIPNRHIEHTEKLINKELLELKEIEKFIKNFYKWENYFSFIRQTNWWKTVKHIHYHYLPWILHSDWVEEIMKKQHLVNN